MWCEKSVIRKPMKTHLAHLLAESHLVIQNSYSFTFMFIYIHIHLFTVKIQLNWDLCQCPEHEQAADCEHTKENENVSGSWTRASWMWATECEQKAELSWLTSSLISSFSPCIRYHIAWKPRGLQQGCLHGGVSSVTTGTDLYVCVCVLYAGHFAVPGSAGSAVGAPHSLFLRQSHLQGELYHLAIHMMHEALLY